MPMASPIPLLAPVTAAIRVYDMVVEEQESALLYF